MRKRLFGYARVALSYVGSAILLFSCDNSGKGSAGQGNENLMTEYSEHLSLVMSQNGRRSYLFETPLLEGYTLAREPYREFRKGIKITTYQNDSLSAVDVVLTANYAIYYENRELWETKGDVVARKESEDRTLYTQQLFWNAKTHKIYSNVDTKVVENGGRNVYFGESFESDEEFRDWRFRRNRIRMEVDVTPTESNDSVAAPKPRRDAGPVTPRPEARPRSTTSAASVQPMPPVRRGEVSVHAEEEQRVAGAGNAPVMQPADELAVPPAPGRRGDQQGKAPAAPKMTDAQVPSAEAGN